MLAVVQSCALRGIDAVPVAVEVNSGERGDLKFVIVGLPDTAIKESCDRIFSALLNSGYAIPHTRTTVNLAPSHIKKEGSFYDLPIALGVIQSTGQCYLSRLDEFIIAGELGLSGKIREIKGGLTFAMQAKKEGKRLLLPVKSAHEAAFVDSVEIFAVNNLNEAARFLSGQIQLFPAEHKNFLAEFEKNKNFLDFSEIKGQFALRRAMEVAVAGGHNILMIGPPGSGKSMIAKRIPGIMSMPTFDEFLETMSIYSAAGLLMSGEKAYFERPFRSPHHTTSNAGLLGGGSIPCPGEISLAHNGVLFLDELAEFRRTTLESLRQPLEDGEVMISRSSGKIKFPCNAMIVGAMNPCPCGYLGDRNHRCRCSRIDIQRYRSRISGPMIDRFDIQIDVPAVAIEDIQSRKAAESSADIKFRVEMASKIQMKRFRNSKNKRNASMSHGEIMDFCELDGESSALLAAAMGQLSLSARAYDKILKVGRTIADLEGEERILTAHILESIQYRSLDRS
ncbi:MAG: YifB family Mg chelatase-like AAA ATPase [Puniceicoccales bacterium]|jgi:magnesium chelatase family protein|nr:YifB family Mg chelatase-like AAA ATPase [Puniceicoccales bacterium]